MESFSILTIFVFLITGCCAQTDSITFPGGLGSEIWSLITNGTLEHFVGCKSYDNFTENDIGYILYNRELDYPVTLTLDNLHQIDLLKDTKILFNGWTQTAHDENLLGLVNAYLSRYDCNVITVEYSNISNTEYSQAYCNAIKGSEIMTDFFCKVHNEGYFNLGEVHMVGFSLGAQIIGLIGQGVQQKCNQKVNRLTGLDPAGPIYQDQDISMRLDKSDAKFVDAIHTNGGMLGYYGSVGHVDFFPNCGSIQPGCIQIKNFPDVITIILNIMGCSHGSSVDYFTESVYGTGPVFNSTSCFFCPNSEGVGKCIGADDVNPQYTIMGEDCPRNPPAKRFVLRTNSKSPHARG